MAATLAEIRENQLLAGLGQSELAGLQDDLELVDLKLSERLSQADKPIRYAYFPLTGMISLVQSFDDGSTSEVGLVGREGFWGTPLILGSRTSPVEAMVQGRGRALRIRAGALIAAVKDSAELRARFLRYTQFLHVQVAITAACNGQHKVRQRLARWLLEAQDRLDSDEVPLSHEFLSFMLGVRRAGVTAALSAFRTTGVINTGRGHIAILDRHAIETEACECYRIVKAEYRRLYPRVARTLPAASKAKSDGRR